MFKKQPLQMIVAKLFFIVCLMIIIIASADQKERETIAFENLSLISEFRMFPQCINLFIQRLNRVSQSFP